MAAPVPTTEPLTLFVGDTWKWTKSLSDYPATDGWTLTYYFRILTSASQSASNFFNFAASAVGADYSVSVAAASTAGKDPGRYKWDAFVTKGAEKYHVGTGETVLEPDPTVGGDLRLEPCKTLDAINAQLAGRSDVEEYEVNGRSIKKTPVGELVKLRDKYSQLCATAKQAEKIRKGLDSGRKIFTTFVDK